MPVFDSHVKRFFAHFRNMHGLSPTEKLDILMAVDIKLNRRGQDAKRPWDSSFREHSPFFFFFWASLNRYIFARFSGGAGASERSSD